MDTESFSISLASESGGLCPATVSISEDGDECRVELTFSGEALAALAPDYFSAFVEVRAALGLRGMLPLCYAAAENVYPSPMSLQMGGGLKAYRLTIGKPARTEDLVFIFSHGPDVTPVSPAAQEEFYGRWLESIGARGVGA